MSIARHQAAGAYRRWEPETFDSRGNIVEATPAPTAAIPEPPLEESAVASPLPEGIPLPTAQDIERIHSEAHATGHAEGYAAGHAEGYAAGRGEGEEAGRQNGYETGYQEGRTVAESEGNRLRELAGNFDQALTGFDAEVAEELRALVIEIARKVVGNALRAQPDAILETIRAALMQLPQNGAQIHLHPDDLALAREQPGEQFESAGHRLIEDSSLTPGGCRIESPGAQIDATVETRWRRVIEHISQHGGAWEARS